MNRVLRKFISILLAVLLIGGCTIQWNTIIAFAEETGEIKTYENFKYVVNGDEVTITGYIGKDVNIIGGLISNTNWRTTFEIRISKGLSFCFCEYSVNLMANKLKFKKLLYII